MTGLRPIVDLTVASFVFGAMDQFVSQVAKTRYMFGGQARLPLVVRAALYYQGGTAGHHADRPYPMFMNVPGLKIIVPSTAPDLKGLLKSAIRDDNPVLCFEDANLWGRRGRGERPAPGDHLVPLGKAAIRRTGADVTVVGIGLGAVLALRRRPTSSAAQGIDVEVVDPRTLAPMDWPAILESVTKTGRLVVVDPGHAHLQRGQRDRGARRRGGLRLAPGADRPRHDRRHPRAVQPRAREADLSVQGEGRRRDRADGALSHARRGAAAPAQHGHERRRDRPVARRRRRPRRGASRTCVEIEAEKATVAVPVAERRSRSWRSRRSRAPWSRSATCSA